MSTLLTGVGLGVAGMYLLDPDRGRTRRAHLAQKMNRLGHIKTEAWDAASRDARNRLMGLWHDAASKFAKDDVSDEALQARVRSAMGRRITHPGAVEVACSGGQVTLSGDILASEVENLIACAKGVKGVKGVLNELNVHNSPGNISALQGDGSLPGPENPLQMPPGPALAAGLIGVGLVILGSTRKSPAGTAVATAGAALAAKSMMDMEGRQLKQLVGIRG